MKTSKYKQLESELENYKPVMSRAFDAVLGQGITKYPILIIHKEQINIGIPLVDEDQVEGNWSVRMSTLEEFVAKKLIEEIKVDSFCTVYKDKKKYLCLFVLSELGAQFIFMPKK